MRNIVVLAALAIATFMSSGCASIVSGTSQTVSVTSAPKDGAECEMKNDKGSWRVKTPGTTTVSKAAGELAVICEHPDGLKGVTSAQSQMAGAIAGNLLIGGVIGAGIDLASGAAYLYPASIHVPMTPVATPAQAPPAAISATTPAASRLSKDDAESQLKDLAALKAKRLISQSEYDQKVKEVLARMG